MDLADLFQKSKRLWTENERVRRRLDDVLREARRSLGQQPDHLTVAPEFDGSIQELGGSNEQNAPPHAESGD